MAQTKEEKAAKHKIWCENNKEHRATYAKEYDRVRRLKEKELRLKEKEIRDKLYVKPTDEELRKKNKVRDYTKKKMAKLYNWKARGVKGDLSMFYDDKYLPATNCDICDKVFQSSFYKCMDHNHQTGEVRQVYVDLVIIRMDGLKSIKINKLFHSITILHTNGVHH